jgi:hypothetical protein
LKEWENAMSLNVPQAGVVSISKLKSREEVLAQLLPKIFGVICERGRKIDGFLGSSVQLDGDLVLTGSLLGPDRIILSIYWPVNSRTMKVFSAHVTDTPACGDAKFYRYFSGSVGILSWRRGVWEEAIMLDGAPPRSVSEAFFMGLFGSAGTLFIH